MAANTSKSSLACPRCSFVGKSEQSLKVHIGRAHGSARAAKRRAYARRGHTCTLCNKPLKNAATLKAHMTRVHGGKSAAVRGVSPLQRRLMELSLGELADLYEACRTDLLRRFGA